MAADPLDALRLALMQDVLPVGLAVVERARKGGPREVLAAFDGTSSDPLGQLRQEGEPVASQLRDSLDRLQPGLGNPVVKVEVRDMPAEPGPPAAAAPAADELETVLARIAQRLDLLEQRLAEARRTNGGAASGGASASEY
ncbi:MAG: hypothetical protein ACK5FE_03300 [Cyanobacteriota bacterium]|jgi:hypothetical protein